MAESIPRIGDEKPGLTSFPKEGLPENDVLKLLAEKVSQNVSPERNFANSYAGPTPPLALKAYSLGMNSLFVSGWGQDLYRGTYEMEKEAVRMVSSLLNLTAESSAGFITSGGTESNILALRIAKLLTHKTKQPEIVMPCTAHSSLLSAADLFGIKANLVELNEEDYTPRMEQAERMINENTIALVCSAPEAYFSGLDPVEEFAEIAEKRDLYLHVDAAWGGFIYPFMRELGYNIPPFDFGVAQVSSMTADGHKLGILPIACSFALFRSRSYLEAIPTEIVGPATITSTKNGGVAAAAWAMFQHLGREGYKNHVRNALDVTKTIADGVERINGLRLVRKPSITHVAYTTTDGLSVPEVYKGLRRKGWGTIMLKAPGPRPFQYMRQAVHPYQSKENAQRMLTDLEEAVRDARNLV